MPQQGMDRQAYLHAKFGPAASAVYARISKAGSESGIDFNFMDIEKTPDTRPIHKLLIAAGQQAEPLSELFYHAYFLDGLDISSQEVQEYLIAKAGLDAPSLYAEDDAAEKRLADDLDEGRMVGIEGGIRAEAYGETGNNLGTAIDDINAIRTRAGITSAVYLLDVGATAEDIVEAARYDYRKETVGMGLWVEQLQRHGAMGEDVTIRSAPWDCPGMALQFSASEGNVTGFEFNEVGGCN